MSGSRTDEALQSGRIGVATAFSQTLRKSKVIAANGKLLFFLFLLTLPLANPWVRGDGVGYYAYVRSLLIDHDLRFENDYLQANQSFVMAHVDAEGRLLPRFFTKTGYVENHFAVGPAILWAPVMITVHGLVLLANSLGAHIAPDGYSRPYLMSMAMTTACYGFLSLYLAFRMARKYFGNPWAFLATISIWMASSLPIYMYFNPSWSHALSAFTVALFLWYWDRTRETRTAGQWAILGVLAGLMGNVYYPNAILLIFPALETALLIRASRLGSRINVTVQNLALGFSVFLAAFLASLLPTFVTRQIIYGSPFETGYPPVWGWSWGSPVLLKVLFSSDHGMFSWTPVLLLSAVGLVFLVRRDFLLGMGSLLTFLAYWYFIASYPDWDGISSFGNRFFVSLSPIFLLGLTALASALADRLGNARRAMAVACPVLALLIVWNFGFIFQWGTHMVPARGEISWKSMVHNQFVEVPLRMEHTLETYFTHRGEMMQHIEEQDIEQQKPEWNGGK